MNVSIFSPFGVPLPLLPSCSKRRARLLFCSLAFLSSASSFHSYLLHYHRTYYNLLTPGNGSDVFGSDICTCKPYLTYAIEECIRCAQRGGVGVVAYFRKEGRALGEVTK